ncbi:V-type ATP synthase subunit E [Anaerohalosphaera lusitana]|uniref:V-type proton ATPase subunit E n=1 Tax=Anaerohalosphaera lusitana TaxID=1936003 RepID=A0A1U9NJU4_9BACT|nr:V-type ATP synthase subunit E [Anaerohalosphaera lusitana]AQT68008.1 V-type ATP synthase subunit E [Anaerohalosphaera lusitana]
MDAKEVVSKILAEANTEADSIKADAEQKVRAQKEQFDAKMDRFKKESDAKAEKAAEEARQQQLAAARMDIKKQKSQAKAQLLNDVFEKALDELVAMPDDRYKDLMTKLMIKAAQTGDEEVIIGKDEKRIDENLVKNVNRQLGSDKKGSLKLASERADIKGGFILSRGKINVNASAQVLIEQAREELDIDIASELFED